MFFCQQKSAPRILCLALAISLVIAANACARQTTALEKENAENEQQTKESRFHLGNYSYPITTKSDAAQKAFDRGLTLAYAFNYESAEKEFRQAVALDSSSALPWWGVALVNGPHINFPLVPPDRAKAAWEALTNARANVVNASPLEKELVAALAERYRENQPEDRAPLDKAYAAAMEKLWQANPKNADIGTMYAEAMMNLRPWDLWTAEGKPQPGTDRIIETLEGVLSFSPNHPGANHLYIHAIEASPYPARGLAAADRLRSIVPEASHLVHMPAHIYVRTGRWKDAEDSNVAAVEADEFWRASNPKPGLYAMYMAHNHHFLAFAAMMRGRKATALSAARTMVSKMPGEFLTSYASIADGFTVFVPEVMLRFGMWEEVLAEAKPRNELPFAMAMWRFTRATALNALGREKELRTEFQLFRKAVKLVPETAFFGNNSSITLLKIADHVLQGEIAARKNNYGEAIDHLHKAVRIEDTLRYDEPPDWVQPVRHTLGAVLLKAKRFREAERIYHEDLARFPENGWSLFGLAGALREQGKSGEYEEVLKRFKLAWADADIEIETTCFCQKTEQKALVR